jgi:hypothetical protein
VDVVLLFFMPLCPSSRSRCLETHRYSLHREILKVVYIGTEFGVGTPVLFQQHFTSSSTPLLLSINGTCSATIRRKSCCWTVYSAFNSHSAFLRLPRPTTPPLPSGSLLSVPSPSPALRFKFPNSARLVAAPHLDPASKPVPSKGPCNTTTGTQSTGAVLLTLRSLPAV